MDRLHQSASTRFPSRIRIVTTDISISSNLALTDSAPQEKLFLGSYKVIQAIRSLPKSCYRSNVLWLMITSSFTCLDRTITKCLLSFAITIALKKKYLDSMRHLVAASLKMFSPFFRYILSLHSLLERYLLFVWEWMESLASLLDLAREPRSLMFLQFAQQVPSLTVMMLQLFEKTLVSPTLSVPLRNQRTGQWHEEGLWFPHLPMLRLCKISHY